MRAAFYPVAALTVLYCWLSQFTIGFLWEILYGPVQVIVGPNMADSINQWYVSIQLTLSPSFWVFFPQLLVLLMILAATTPRPKRKWYALKTASVVDGITGAIIPGAIVWVCDAEAPIEYEDHFAEEDA